MSANEWERAGDGCRCWVNPNPYTYNGITEPGDALEPDFGCPNHFPKPICDGCDGPPHDADCSYVNAAQPEPSGGSA